jgi:hypothetical protein
MLTSETLVPQYLVCNWLAALALGLTGSQRQQGIKFFKEEFHMPAKKKPAKKAAKKKAKK